MNNRVNSYTAANSFPMKVLKNEVLMRSLNCGKVVPWHVQLNLTNACNFKCDFCSCANRNQSLTLPFDEVVEMMTLYKSLGMSSLTITGGGETLLYPQMSSLLKVLHNLGVDVGLVTNGSLLHTLSVADLNRIHWCRISASDVLHKNIKIEDWFTSVDSAVSKDSTVGWAFSYVVGAYPNLTLMKKIIQYANEHDFTHVRIVSDLLDLNVVPNMSAIQGGLLDLGVDVSKVIFQGRKTFKKGFTPCYISLLKPVVGADGLLYACCIDGNEIIIVKRNGINQPIQMKEVKVGDICPTENGTGIVREVFKKPPEPTLQITLRTGRSIVVSKDHIMLVAKDIKNYRDTSQSHSQRKVANYTLVEKQAVDLRIGDVIPVMRGNCVKHQQQHMLTEDQAKLLGYYTAEGWMDADGGTTLMIGKNDVIKDELYAVLDRLGISKRVYERRTGLQIALHRRTMTKEMKEMLKSCGSRSLLKHVAPVIFGETEPIIIAYLYALIQGDGHIMYRNNNPSLELKLSTSSRRLASDICYLLSTLDMGYSVTHNKREGPHIIEGRQVHMRDRYIVTISGYNGLKKFPQLKLWNVAHQRDSGLDFPKTSRLLFIPVTKIEELNSNNELYDIKVDTTNRFFAGMGFLVHNCGSQYSQNNTDKNYVNSMGHWRDLPKLIEEQAFFKGAEKCKRCYYEDYQFIGEIMQPLDDERFV